MSSTYSMSEAETSFLSNPPTSISCDNLIKGVRGKQVALADIQRASVWDSKTAKQLDLFRSMYLGIPVGVLYIWEPGVQETSLRHRHLEGLESYYNPEEARLLLLDGQQRVTTICKLHFSKKPQQYHLMKRVVLDLSKDPRIDKVFRFEKNNNYPAKSNEVIIQDLLITSGLLAESERINNSELDDKTKLDYVLKINRAREAFTTRKISVQYINHNADLKDALRIFSTVNQAGVALADPDFIQAILTSIYPEFHSEIYKLERILQRVQTGEDDDGEPVYSKLTGFKRDIILKAMIWQLYGTTKRKAAIVNDNLDIYSPKSLTKLPSKEWKDLNKLEKEEITVPLTKEKISEEFKKIKDAAKSFKKRLKKELFFASTSGHSANSILGGIIFYINYSEPTDKEIGKLLCWYILSSYHLEWTGGSTDPKVDNTCRFFSNSNGVQWNKLWMQMQKESEVESKVFTGDIEDLFPKIGEDQFPGVQSRVTGKTSGLIEQLISKTIPFNNRMRDWFTGEKLWDIGHRKFSIHHFFPQNRFKMTDIIRNLNKLEINYSDLSDTNKHDLVKGSIVKEYDVAVKKISDINDQLEQLEVEIKEYPASIKLLKLNDASDEEAINRLKKARKKKTDKRYHLKKDLSEKEYEASKYEKSIEDYEASESVETRTQALQNACEFWFSYSSHRLSAIHHPANLVSIATKSNSSIGDDWPSDYLPRLLAHEKRISRQFMILDDLSLFNAENYSDFILKRTKWQHQALTKFLKSLLNGSWTDVQPQEEIKIEELLSQSAEIILERKATVYFDKKSNKSTWEILKNKGKSVHYLREAIVRAVLAFGNSGGGHVLVGVDDDGTIFGLEKDFEIIQSKYSCSENEARDEIIKSLSTQIENSNQDFCKTCEMEFIDIEEKTILWIKVRGFNKTLVHKKYSKTKRPGIEDVEFVKIMKNVVWIRLQGRTVEREKK